MASMLSQNNPCEAIDAADGILGTCQAILVWLAAAVAVVTGLVFVAPFDSSQLMMAVTGAAIYAMHEFLNFKQAGRSAARKLQEQEKQKQQCEGVDGSAGSIHVVDEQAAPIPRVPVRRSSIELDRASCPSDEAQESSRMQPGAFPEIMPDVDDCEREDPSFESSMEAPSSISLKPVSVIQHDSSGSNESSSDEESQSQSLSSPDSSLDSAGAFYEKRMRPRALRPVQVSPTKVVTPRMRPEVLKSWAKVRSHWDLGTGNLASASTRPGPSQKFEKERREHSDEDIARTTASSGADHLPVGTCSDYEIESD
eukprot:gnl/TRDRNA2_/TRDRNA2_56193_c0_seq1.p1 gnl/TRDRNA2_/TRDRNA2_56193_c0~~gnl/TRDRNA2_/TRDRNA2_56193_c0_seq1.p1  ORF type:complete len:311 (+),score=61.53 gnl/TRDRNA2_/TRDRNA2_56193_c0_seq1:75-1007(+)